MDAPLKQNKTTSNLLFNDISKDLIISHLNDFKQYAAQRKFENFTSDMMSLINKFEKLIYSEPKEMVQNTLDKYLV
jgi:hypothetical protein